MRGSLCGAQALPLDKGVRMSTDDAPDREDEEEVAEGGHAAERLEEFLNERFPSGLPAEENPTEVPVDDPANAGDPEEDTSDGLNNDA